MSVLSWNCRGLSHQSVVSSLKNLIQTYNPEIVFLFETLLLANNMEMVKMIVGFDSCFNVDRVGKGGGIAV